MRFAKLTVWAMLFIVEVFAAPSGDDVHWSPQFGPPGLRRTPVAAQITDGAEIMASQHCGPGHSCPVEFWDGQAWRTIGTVHGQGPSHYAFSILKEGNIWYFGGGFDMIDDIPLKNIATWDGGNWSPVGLGVDEEILAMAMHQGKLHIAGVKEGLGGSTVWSVMRWEGDRWTNLATPNFRIDWMLSLVGDGDDLYAAGEFYEGGTFGGGVARWDGEKWQLVGKPESSARGVALFRGGLYAVFGPYIDVGPRPNRSFLGKWDGTAWTEIGAFRGDGPTELAVWNDSLYVSGGFTNIDSRAMRYLARYDGTNFHEVPAVASPIDGRRLKLNTSEAGVLVSGEMFYFGPSAEATEWTYAPHLALWNGDGFTNLYNAGSANGAGYWVETLAEVDGKVFAGGPFLAAGTGSLNGIGGWDGAGWSGLGEGLVSTNLRRVFAIEELRGEVFVGGTLKLEGSHPATNIALWNGQNWRQAGAGFNGSVLDLLAYKGEMLAAGRFTASGSKPVRFVARWTGTDWDEFGCCLPEDIGAIADLELMDERLFVLAQGANNWVYELRDGNFEPIGRFGGVVSKLATLENALYLGGREISLPDSGEQVSVARWDGANWTRVGSTLNGTVNALVAHARKLYAAGSFQGSATTPHLNGIARLIQGDWRPLGSGLAYTEVSSPRAYDLLSMGGDLYVAGIFQEAGAVHSSHIARWNEEIDFYAAVRISSISLSDGLITLRVESSDTTSAVLEASHDLKTWSGTATNAGSFTFSEPAGVQARCFRAVRR